MKCSEHAGTAPSRKIHYRPRGGLPQVGTCEKNKTQDEHIIGRRRRPSSKEENVANPTPARSSKEKRERAIKSTLLPEETEHDLDVNRSKSMTSASGTKFRSFVAKSGLVRILEVV